MVRRALFPIIIHVRLSGVTLHGEPFFFRRLMVQHWETLARNRLPIYGDTPVIGAEMQTRQGNQFSAKGCRLVRMGRKS